MIAYLECTSGASGDMILGALIDAGADIDFIRKQVERCGLPVEIQPREVTRRGLRATRVEVTGGERRAFEDQAGAEAILDKAQLDPEVDRGAREVIGRLAGAEARVHGSGPPAVVFHELGQADTIVDAVGVAAGFAWLEVEDVVSSVVTTGRGTIRGEHGPLPVPAPATLELLRGIPIRGVAIDAELVTPTGAAILAAFVSEFGDRPPMRLERIGYGAGSADLEIPNILRLSVGERVEDPAPDLEEILIETNIDDMSPEFFPYVSERLFEAGASDVWLTPAIGKHGRPCQTLSVLAQPAFERATREVLVRETTSLGMRIIRVGKWMANRRFQEVSIEGYPVRVKIAEEGGVVVNLAPEYSDCAEVARRTGLPLKEVHRLALLAAADGSSSGGRGAAVEPE